MFTVVKDKIFVHEITDDQVEEFTSSFCEHPITENNKKNSDLVLLVSKMTTSSLKQYLSIVLIPPGAALYQWSILSFIYHQDQIDLNDMLHVITYEGVKFICYLPAGRSVK